MDKQNINNKRINPLYIREDGNNGYSVYDRSLANNENSTGHRCVEANVTYEHATRIVYSWYINDAKEDSWFQFNGSYRQFTGYNKDGYPMFRLAGESICTPLCENVLSTQVESPIIPYFGNAKVGDECFITYSGKGVIDLVDDNEGLEIATKNGIFNVDGKLNDTDEYPTFFNSYDQFMAYWKEMRFWGKI